MTPIPEDREHRCERLKRRTIMNPRVPKKVREFLKQLNELPISMVLTKIIFSELS